MNITLRRRVEKLEDPAARKTNGAFSMCETLRINLPPGVTVRLPNC